MDIEPTVKPDLCLDFKKALPFPDNFIDKIYFFHVIEHIEEKHHETLLREFRRVLKPTGEIYISYPEFVVCAKNYMNNLCGQKKFWRNTIFGRQLYPSDYHVSLMDSRDFVRLLQTVGFGAIMATEESKQEPYNTVVHAVKVGKPRTYEDTLNLEIFNKVTVGAE